MGNCCCGSSYEEYNEEAGEEREAPFLGFSGWLFRRNQGFPVKYWQKRWFVLQPDGYMVFYNLDGKVVPGGYPVDVDDLQTEGEVGQVFGVITNPFENKKYVHNFELDSPTLVGEWQLAAETADEKTLWLEALERASRIKPPMNYVPPKAPSAPAPFKLQTLVVEYPMDGIGIAFRLYGTKDADFTLKSASMTLGPQEFWDAAKAAYGPMKVGAAKKSFHPVTLVPDFMDAADFAGSSDQIACSILVGTGRGKMGEKASSSIAGGIAKLAAQGDPPLVLDVTYVAASGDGVAYPRTGRLFSATMKMSDLLPDEDMPMKKIPLT